MAHLRSLTPGLQHTTWPWPGSACSPIVIIRFQDIGRDNPTCHPRKLDGSQRFPFSRVSCKVRIVSTRNAYSFPQHQRDPSLRRSATSQDCRPMHKVNDKRIKDPDLPSRPRTYRDAGSRAGYDLECAMHTYCKTFTTVTDQQRHCRLFDSDDLQPEGLSGSSTDSMPPNGDAGSGNGRWVWPAIPFPARQVPSSSLYGFTKTTLGKSKDCTNSVFI